MSFVIRILRIKVNNIKNLKNGIVNFPSYKDVLSNNIPFTKSDVLGIYGQNGSSKSALIAGISIFKALSRGEELTSDIYNLIKFDEDSLKIELTFYYEKNQSKSIFEYSVIIKKDDLNNIKIKEESLRLKNYNNFKWSRFKDICTIFNDEDDLHKFIKPASLVNSLNKIDKNSISNFTRLIETKASHKTSILLSHEFVDLLNKINNQFIVSSFIQDIMTYGLNYLHLYDASTLNDFFKDDVVLLVDNDAVITISLFKEGILKNIYEKDLKRFVEKISNVICKLVPNVMIDYKNLGSVNSELFRYQLVTKKENNTLPLVLESSGIKKIISLLSSLIDAFNNPSSTLVIDEFDSGIFEYLQGLILDVFKNKGIGQLLFTSHNLRALEVIKDGIIFTTNDENNRFLELPSKNNKNLRKKYLRELYLGTNPLLANNIDEFDIYQALVNQRDVNNE